MRVVSCRPIVGWSDFIDGRRDLFEMEVRFDLRQFPHLN